METAVKNLFARYQRFFNRALDGDVDLDEGTSFYASAFLAASPRRGRRREERRSTRTNHGAGL
jgi:hypothetical protein